MKISNTSFVIGIVRGNEYWESYIPQIALYGRSNAGKSSSINALLGNGSLARISAVPGKTTEINLFSINSESLYFLDLPGYGFARGSLEQKAILQELILWFIKDTKVKNRIHVMVLDAKIGLTEVDKSFLDFLYKTNEKIIILFNKIDKLNQKEYSKSFMKTQKELMEKEGTYDITLIPFSAKTKKGVDEFWKAVEGEK